MSTPTDRLAAAVTTASAAAGGLCLAGIVGVSALQIVCRYLLNRPLPWPEEVARLLLVWLAYLGALVAPGAGRHVAVGVLHDRLPPAGRRAADLLGDLLGLVFFAALLAGGLALASPLRGVRLPALQLPLALLWGVVPLVAALQVVLHAASLLRRLRGGDPPPAGGGAPRAGGLA